MIFMFTTYVLIGQILCLIRDKISPWYLHLLLPLYAESLRCSMTCLLNWSADSCLFKKIDLKPISSNVTEVPWKCTWLHRLCPQALTGFSALSSLVSFYLTFTCTHHHKQEFTPECLAPFHSECYFCLLALQRASLWGAFFKMFFPCRNAASLFINRLTINAGSWSGVWRANTREGNGL